MRNSILTTLCVSLFLVSFCTFLYNVYSGAIIILHVISPTVESSTPQDTESGVSPVGFINATATAYSPSSTQTDSTPYITATMTKARPGKTMACSRDLMPRLLGRRVYIEGMGVWIVEDLMAERLSNTVDFCLPDAVSAQKFGRKNVTLYVLGE